MPDYEFRKDIDRFKKFLDDLEVELARRGILNLDLTQLLAKYYDKSEVDILLQHIERGDIDLSAYLRRDEANFDFNYSWGNPLLDEDTITIDIFLKED